VRGLSRSGLAFLGALLVCACSTQSPAAPDAVALDAPSVKSIKVSNTHAELTDRIVVTADVTDAATPVDELDYQWSATGGAFIGSGRIVTWTMPKKSAVGGDITFAVTVSRRPRGRAVTLVAPKLVHVQNSIGDISRIAFDFLVTYFGNSNVGADAAVIDFIDPCPQCPSGKAEERSDVQFNRDHFTFISSRIQVLSVELNDARTEADYEAFCAFESREKSSGISGTAYGICTLTALYANGRWWLCESHARPLPAAGFGPGTSPAERAFAQRFFRRSALLR
jgi:hypothetical protein